MRDEDLQTITGWEDWNVLGFGKNVWKIVVKIDNVQYSELSAKISYMCDSTMDLAKNPLEYLMKRYRYFARELELFESQANQTLFQSLFNSNVAGGYEQFFGEFYPLVCHVKNRWKKMEGNNGKYAIIGDGTNRYSILNSFSRLARILMSLNLGKCLMVVKFDFTSKEDLKALSECKKEYCLSYGIVHEGHKYCLLGTSNSGLKGDSCIFYNSTLLNLEILKQMLGTFEKAEEHGPRKVASRVGLSMGTSTPSIVEWKQDDIQIISDDIAVTDGAGMAVEDFFEQVLENTYSVPYFFMDKLFESDTKQGRLFEKNFKNISAMQVRILGAKGVIQKVNKSMWAELLKKHKLPSNTKVILRNSMVKFEGNYSIYNKIDILNVARVHGGNINRNIMSCLLQMTTNEEEMEKLFKNFYETQLMEIVENKDNPEYLCNVLLSQSGETSQESIARDLIMAEHSLDNYFISSVVKDNIESKFESMVSDKLSMKCKHPGFLSGMGVYDESSTLKHDEVHIPCSKLIRSLDYAKIDKVLVYRNPLAYEGDIQCLKLVKHPPTEFLQSRRDVIVFGHNPNYKKVPEPLCYMAGGDLDGDLYEIIFDPEIVKLFDQNLKPKLNYNDGAATNKVTKTVKNSLSMEDVRKTVLEMMEQSSKISEVYLKTMCWREDSSKVGIDIKLKLSKMYHDSIDTIKGSAFNAKQLYEIPKKDSPKWMELCKLKITDQSHIELDTFEARMFDLIRNIFNRMVFSDTKQLDTVFENPSEIYSSEWQRWKDEFKEAYSQWRLYWSTRKNDEIVLSDKFSAHKQKLFESIKDCLEEDKINWEKVFIKHDGDSLDKLNHKAAYWLFHTYNQYIEEDDNEFNLEERFKSLIRSPFVYTCCLFNLNCFKLFNNQEEKMPHIVSPRFTIRIKQSRNEKVSKTILLECPLNNYFLDLSYCFPLSKEREFPSF
ncbi:predicted protein [Naegleria gruberi]|uniref:RNA-dependent RNA polymerase n=1 Tax=Naegleria gruberi TaxID=5762 RepID=D2VSR9_NAEGR|nr:uncharacterized protein NAEGRDRAFT_72038 [Naegleria gruberi]EFC40243.1 predicted protein [Naegleria gruberi]|eukprot:XP_002672987.1 predicted protein [Naegleria gruberi strain NEG-M]